MQNNSSRTLAVYIWQNDNKKRPHSGGAMMKILVGRNKAFR